MVTNAPIAQPVDTKTRERINAGNQSQQRSEDIHPTPPTLRPSGNPQTNVRHSDSEESGSEASRSDGVSESDDEAKSSAPINPVPPPTTSRSNVQQNTTTAPAVRSSNTPQTDARVTTTQNPPTTSRTTTQNPPTPSRTTTQNPPAPARTTTDNNARQAAGTAPNPNSKLSIIYFSFYKLFLSSSSFCTTRTTSCN